VSRRCEGNPSFQGMGVVSPGDFHCLSAFIASIAFLSNPLLTRVPSGACHYHSFTPPPPSFSRGFLGNGYHREIPIRPAWWQSTESTCEPRIHLRGRSQLPVERDRATTVIKVSKPPRKLATTLWLQPVEECRPGCEVQRKAKSWATRIPCNFDTDAGKLLLDAPSKSEEMAFGIALADARDIILEPIAR
jgi:hypothetical protein